MRIAYVVHQFPPYHLGGTENYAWSLGRQMAQAGHEVNVFYPLAETYGEDQQITRDGMNQWRAAVAPDRAAAGPAREFVQSIRERSIEESFAHFLEETQPDLLHVQHLQNVSVKLLALAETLPTVMTLQDYWYFCANGQLIRPKANVCQGTTWGMNCVDCAAGRGNAPWLPYLRPLAAVPFYLRNQYIKRLLKQVSHFIAPSEFLRQMYIKNGFPAHKIQTSEYGLDLERAKATEVVQQKDIGSTHQAEDDSALKAASALIAEESITWGQESPLHVGFLGNIVPQKGVDVLVRAFNQMPPEARLTIHGGETAFPEFASSLREAATHPGIRFGGPLHHEFTGMVLQSFDCLVIPSIWYENSPLVIQEAFGVGVPVIGSRLGSMPEKIQDGKTGRLFEVGNADDLAAVLKDILQNKAQLAAYKKNIQPAPSMQEHAQEVLSIYNSLL